MSSDRDVEVTQPQAQYNATHVIDDKDGLEANEKALGPTPDGEEPTQDEIKNLRHIAENLPVSAWLVAIVELCERFTYYGMSGLYQNYANLPLDGSQGRGALGLGHQGATGLTTFNQFWCYVTPIVGAIVADQYLGKYKTIVLFSIIYMIGLLILVCTSIPSSLEHGAGLGGFVVAILIVGLGTGGIKSNVAPLIADQYKRKKMAITTIAKTGERVVIDPALTIQRIYMIFYGCINVGSLSLLATPYMERDIGYWSGYLLCLCMFICGSCVLIVGRKYYVVRPPQGSIITNAFKALWIMVINRNMDAPKPTWQAEHGSRDVPWDDHFVDELKRALVACKVFAFYPIYWVVYTQFSSNFVTQADQMEGHGVPNDLMQNFDPISIIVFIPVLELTVYPLLRRCHIQFRPITRIALGFIVASLAMMYAAIVQHLIYSAGPCYEHPGCDASIVNGQTTGNRVHIAIQTPAYVFIGLSEIFASVSGLEYAYTKAPPTMKSFVQSMYLLTNAFGAAIAEALTPAAYDPAILWMFVGLAVASFLAGIIFFIVYRHLNHTEDEMNALDADDDVVAAAQQAEEEKRRKKEESS